MSNFIDREPEWKTRRDRIDPRLVDAGWTIIPFSEDIDTRSLTAHAVTEYETAYGPADYVLIVKGHILAIVEAKRYELGPEGVMNQAKRYSRGVTGSTLNYAGFHVPFLYTTNGEVICFLDVRNDLNLDRKTAGFHTPAALMEMMFRNHDEDCTWFADNPNAHHRLRPYQIEANNAVEAAITNRKRRMLVAMATGTGKTFTFVNQIYRLMKSGVGKRILFLVDRRALAAQAVRAFASFEAEPNIKFNKIYEVYSNRFQREDFGEEDKFDPQILPGDYLKRPEPKHAFVYVCTIQRMAINLFGRDAVWNQEGDDIDEDAEKTNIPIHAFDVIVADECHRGYSTAEESLWRNTLDHFDAIKIGLTATPASHTKAYFRDVIYRYEYARAVSEGYLVDYDVVSIKSDVRIKGVFLKEEETVSIVDPDSGASTLDEIEDEREFDADDVEKVITSPDSNLKIIKEIKKYATEHEQKYGRFPKTLIFAENDLPHTSHADQLVELAREIFGHGHAFVQKITGRVDRPLQSIREFRNRPDPAIVVTVDLLSTGVDIPDLEYIVFLRKMKSRILFEQMLGRGTRKSEKYPDKSHFTVFDCFDGTLIEYFRKSTGMTADPPDKPVRTIEEVIEDVWANRDRDYNIRCLVKRLQRIDKEMAPEARDIFAAHGIPDGDIAKFARELPKSLHDDFMGTMRILRNPSLILAFVKYPRRKRTFIVAVENEDTVSSQWLVRDGMGNELKPEDYILAFCRYVTENASSIEAIEILLNRPRSWRTDVLMELKSKLFSAPERFTIENLQKAHKIRYDKALADIISMVKHAAREDEPLYNAEERVDRAIRMITDGKVLTDEQANWMERIRGHLIENLSIDREDFELTPILVLAGGWKPADRAFDGQLKQLIDSLMENIAA